MRQPKAAWFGSLLALSAVMTWALVASAQYRGGGGGWSYSSTAAEGAARGMADVVRSAGVANLLNSEASKNYEDARSKAYDNRMKNSSTYFETRAINRAAREAEAGPPLTSDQLFRIAHRAAPKPLTTHEFDPVTGEINWPLVLRDDAFTSYRAPVEQLVTQRFADGKEFSYQTVTELQGHIDGWTAALTARIKEYKPQEFIEAKRFLESLSYQARKSS